MPARTLGPEGGRLEVPYQLEMGTSASDDVGSQRGVDCEIPHRLRRRMKHSL